MAKPKKQGGPKQQLSPLAARKKARRDLLAAKTDDRRVKKADAQKLEQGAKELKLMFLQFAELIDTQGDNLTAIEANIKTVIDETSEAIGILQDAESFLRNSEVCCGTFGFTFKPFEMHLCLQ